MTTLKLDNCKTQQPQKSTTPLLNDPKTKTPKLLKTKGQGRASGDSYNFFPERQPNLLVWSAEFLPRFIRFSGCSWAEAGQQPL